MKKNLVLLIVMSLFMAFFSSCSKSGADVIPEDAQVVASVDLKKTALAMKDIKGDVSAQLRGYLVMFPLSQESKDFLKEVIENPNASGIKVTAPIYFSLLDAENKDMMISGMVSDQEAVEKSIQLLAKEANKEVSLSETATGIKYFDFGDVIFMYNSDYFVVKQYTLGESASPIDVEMEKYFTMEKSFVNTAAYKHFASEDGLAKLVVTPESYKALSAEELAELYGSPITPEELGNTSIVMPLNMKKGQIIGAVDIEWGSEKMIALANEASLFREIEGSFVPYISEKSVLIAAANVDGGKFWNKLQEDCSQEEIQKIVKNLKVDLPTLGTCVQSIDGDVTLAVGNKMVDDVPNMAIYVETVSDSLVTLLSADTSFTAEGKDKWVHAFGANQGDGVENGKVVMGYEDETSYLVVGDENVQPFNKVDDKMDSDWFDNKLLYARLNMRELLKLEIDGKTLADIYHSDRHVYELLKLIDFIDLSVDKSASRMEWKIETIQKDKTPLELLYNMFF